MRIKVNLAGRGLIPFNYNLALAGAVYGAVKRVNTDLAYRIHSSTEYKYFTFSLLPVDGNVKSYCTLFVKITKKKTRRTSRRHPESPLIAVHERFY